MSTVVAATGQETIVDAFGCDPAALRELARVEALLRDAVLALALCPVAPLLSHVFPGEAGVTAMLLLAESHLTAHTFPEHGTLAVNLYTCSPRPDFPWENEIRARFSASRVTVRRLLRGGA